MRTGVLKAAGCVAFLAGTAVGQSTLEAPIGEFRSVAMDTGTWANSTAAPVVVAAFPIEVAGASWLRAYVDEASLPEGSSVRFSSMLDGEVQELDGKTLEMWSLSSAYFNGGTLLVELIAGPHTAGNRITIKRIGVEVGIRPTGSPGQCGIVGGVDDRTLSNEAWSARLMPVGCTASIYCNTGAGMVTAGHCLDGQSGMVIHFNVPPSTSGCGTVAPAVADQFPVMPNWQFVNGGVGNDWGVITTGTNSLGQTPFSRYGTFRPISPIVGVVGASTNIWGYGVDDTCVRSQVQQNSAGSILRVLGTHYEILDDVRGGNSGSGYINSDGTIIGIITHCRFDGTLNLSQRTDLPTFVAARNLMHPNCIEGAAPFNDSCGFASPIGPGTITGSTAAATNDGSGACGNSASSNDVWFSFTPQCGGTFRLDTCGSAFDTVLSVHSACGGASLLCNDDHASAGGAGGCANVGDSAIVSTFEGGTTYRIRVAGFGTESGNFNLNLTTIATGSANDACGAATIVGNGVYGGSTICASNDGAACGNSSSSRDVWYSYTPTCSGPAVFDTLASPVGFDTVLSLHSGCPGTSANQIACNDDFTAQPGNLRSRIARNVVGGTRYLVRVGGHSNSQGVFALTIAGPVCAPTCAWDIPNGCTSDFDGDSDFDSDDVTGFFTAWDASNPCADADADQDTDSDDIQVFFAGWSAGGC